MFWVLIRRVLTKYVVLCVCVCVGGGGGGGVGGGVNWRTLSKNYH